MTIHHPLSSLRMCISSHWPFSFTDYCLWQENAKKQFDLSMNLLGYSQLGSELWQIHNLDHCSSSSTQPIIVLCSGQHPIETTSQWAMCHMAETLWQFKIPTVVMGFMNPDGISLAHWRHNAQNLDLNREWGVFTCKETLIYHQAFQKLSAVFSDKMLLFDFHNTKQNLLLAHMDHISKHPLINFFLEFSKPLFQKICSRIDHILNDKYCLRKYFQACYKAPAFTIELDESLHYADAEIFGRSLGNALIKSTFYC